MLKSSKPAGCPVTDGKCHALCVESRWYHGLLFALSLMAQGVFRWVEADGVSLLTAGGVVVSGGAGPVAGAHPIKEYRLLG